MPWRPDVMLCDEDGALAERFGVQDLPAAFLWTWQGNLLEEKLHVDEVEQRIEGWMAALPRVEVEVKDHGRHVGLSADRLQRLIERELSRQGKLTVVVSPVERARLRAKAKASLAMSASEATACAIGQEVSPSSILEVSVTPGRDKQIRLGLVSIESHCRTRDIAEAWDPKEPARSVDRALASLMMRLKHPEPQPPTSLSSPSKLASTTALPPRTAPDIDPYEAALQKAEAAVAVKREKAERFGRAWEAVSKVAVTRELPARERAKVVGRFLEDFPSDNPHREEAERFLGFLKAGREPTAGPEGMVEVPAGAFFMGCNERVDQECYNSEKPGRELELPTFYIDRTEVTVEQYAACVRAGACSASGLDMPLYDGNERPRFASYCNWGRSGRGSHPINCLDWSQARTYCAWAKKRLPTEAEWEKAARGPDGRKYPWGNEGYGRTVVANIADESLKRELSDATIAEEYDDGFVGTAPVGQFPAGASPYGALDMVGNVWEWVEDWYDAGKTRSVRGGSWFGEPRLARASTRDGLGPSDRFGYFGLRCALSPSF